MGFSAILHPDSLLGAHTWSSKNSGTNYTSKAPPPADDPYVDQLHKILADYRKTASSEWEGVPSNRSKPPLGRSLSAGDDVSSRYSEWLTSKDHMSAPPPPSVRFDEDVRYMDEQQHHHHHYPPPVSRGPVPPPVHPPASIRHHETNMSMSLEFDRLLEQYMSSEDTLAHAYEEIEYLKREYRHSSQRCQKLIDQLSGCKNENHMLRREAIVACDKAHDLILDFNRLRDSLDRYRRRIHELEEFVRTRNLHDHNHRPGLDDMHPHAHPPRPGFDDMHPHAHPPRPGLDDMHPHAHPPLRRSSAPNHLTARDLQHQHQEIRDPRLHRDPRDPREARELQARELQAREIQARELRDRELKARELQAREIQARELRDREHAMWNRNDPHLVQDPRRRQQDLLRQHPQNIPHGPNAHPHAPMDQYPRNMHNRYASRSQPDLRNNIPHAPGTHQLRRQENFDLSRSHPMYQHGPPTATPGQPRRRRASLSTPMGFDDRRERELHAAAHPTGRPLGVSVPHGMPDRREPPGPRKRRLSDFLPTFNREAATRGMQMASRLLPGERQQPPPPSQAFHTTTTTTRRQHSLGPHSTPGAAGISSAHPGGGRMQMPTATPREPASRELAGSSSHHGYHDSEIENLEQLLRSSVPDIGSSGQGAHFPSTPGLGHQRHPSGGGRPPPQSTARAMEQAMSGHPSANPMPPPPPVIPGTPHIHPSSRSELLPPGTPGAMPRTPAQGTLAVQPTIAPPSSPVP